MNRFTTTPRADWQKTVESQGLIYHTAEAEEPGGDDIPYWDESAYYGFSSREIDALERATQELDKLCLEACEHIITEKLWDKIGIDSAAGELVTKSWETDEISIYGRFDLAFDGSGQPKLLEYNADTPTSLVEAAVIQWYWMKDKFPAFDQFNSLHERLIEAWGRVKDERAGDGGMVWFSAMADSIEDFITITYLRDTATQAGLQTADIPVEQIGHHAARHEFMDQQERVITDLFKLYPWEWLLADQFGRHIATASTRWLEPPWKMVLSSKGILAVLWELFPDCPYLLPATFDLAAAGSSYVRKPLRSREGANVRIVRPGLPAVETEGPYTGACVYQAYHELPTFDGRHPVIGSWIVNGYACGIGIREDSSLVTGNLSRFIPHVITR
ncbi:MAG: glutathionylspermidine synthase family protein [Phycisphaerales bacterium]